LSFGLLDYHRCIVVVVVVVALVVEAWRGAL
jgi:hypothetical protein